MPRVTGNLWVGGSVAAWVAVAVVIVRSFFVADMVEHFRPGPATATALSRSRLRAVVGRGAVFLMSMDEREVDPPAELARQGPEFVFQPYWAHVAAPPVWVTPVAHGWLGFGYERWAINNPTGWSTPRSDAVRFTLWPALVVLAVPAATRLLAGRARTRGRGACPRCGYDLRASPDGCPECGDGRPPVAATARRASARSSDPRPT